MKNYDWILFDADDTLFHFDALKGLQLTFAKFGWLFSENDYAAYQIVNKQLWLDYQSNKISAQALQQARFKTWAEKLQVTADTLNTTFLTVMLDICRPLDGAIDLLNNLKGKVKLGIITNGFIALQRERLERMGLSDHFDILVISEEVGAAKPSPQIFTHALTLMGNPQPSRVLMVGDNPDADILGGLRAGFDTCWLNTACKPAPKGVIPHTEISTLRELEMLLAETTIA